MVLFEEEIQIRDTTYRDHQNLTSATAIFVYGRGTKMMIRVSFFSVFYKSIIMQYNLQYNLNKKNLKHVSQIANAYNATK